MSEIPTMEMMFRDGKKKVVLWDDHCAVVDALVIDRDTYKSMREDSASFLARQQTKDLELLRIRDDKIRHLENDQAEQGMIIEAILTALDGEEVSDFALSYGIVKRVADLILERDALRKELNDWPKEGLYE